jgi:hypothetical protein
MKLIFWIQRGGGMYLLDIVFDKIEHYPVLEMILYFDVCAWWRHLTSKPCI